MPPKVKMNFKLDGLEKFAGQMEAAKKYTVKVGILGKTNQRSDADRSADEISKNMSNADIGAVHEFGSISEHIPRRSFLRDPFIEKRKDFSQKIEQLVAKHLTSDPQSIKKIFDLIGAYATSIVLKAFATGGFGKWKPLKQQTIDRKGSSKILVDTSQLRRSITWKVESKK